LGRIYRGTTQIGSLTHTFKYAMPVTVHIRQDLLPVQPCPQKPIHQASL